MLLSVNKFIQCPENINIMIPGIIYKLSISNVMAEHNDIGATGEILAQKHFIRNGYTILEKNWRHGKDEIDIIATDGKILVIAEVKTRQSSRLGEPELAVTRDKQRFLVRAADAYIQRHNIDMEARFDIVSVLLQGNNSTINHIMDAFYPTL